MEPKIRVEGLAQFNRGLRKLDSEAPKQLRAALNVAANLLIDTAKPTIPERTGKARASLKARSTRTSVKVAVGGRKAPYFPWLDFGGRTGRNKSVVRPFYTDGRYMFITLRKIRPEIIKTLDESIRVVARNAGLEVD